MFAFFRSLFCCCFVSSNTHRDNTKKTGSGMRTGLISTLPFINSVWSFKFESNKNKMNFYFYLFQENKVETTKNLFFYYEQILFAPKLIKIKVYLFFSSW